MTRIDWTNSYGVVYFPGNAQVRYGLKVGISKSEDRAHILYQTKTGNWRLKYVALTDLASIDKDRLEFCLDKTTQEIKTELEDCGYFFV